jgi:acetate kinase
LRAECCRGLEFLGIRLDPSANEDGAGDRVISPPDCAVRVFALATHEELIVARRAFACLRAAIAEAGA